MTGERIFAFQHPGLGFRFARSGCFALTLAMLAGCGLAEVEHARMETGDVARQVTALRPPQAGPRLSSVRLIERRPYVGLTRIEPDPRAGLPARFRRVDAVTLPLAGIGAAAVLAGRIEAATGLAVRFTGPPRRADDTTGGDTPVNLLGEAGRDRLSPDGGIWTGPLDALLDSWTEPSGYEWRYDADRQAIEIVRRRSAIFQIHALAGKQHYTVSSSTQDSAAGGDGEGSGGGNLTSQTISTETDYDPWPEIEGQLKGLLDPGTRLSVAPSSASVTVSGTPRDIARARAYLGYLNREVLRPVTLSVHVYSVRVEREADYDLGLSFSIARLLGEALRVSVGSNAVALIKPSPGGESGDTLSATVRALNSAGAVSRVLSADIPSLNGKPAQFFELFQEAYLRELRTTAGDGIAQTELVPGTVSSGFAVSYLPRITGPGEVLVRLFASLRDRPSFTAFTSNNQTIQLPAYASRAIQVTQKIGRGETLMVTGFSDRSASRPAFRHLRRRSAAARRRAQGVHGAYRTGASDNRGHRRAAGHRGSPGDGVLSTILINGRPFAAGLYWLERSGPATTARAARRFARPWCVHRAGQTGYAGGTEDDATEGLPALALALVDSIESEFWMALVAGDAAPGDSGGSGRFALTKVRDGAVLADGDEVFSNRDAAVEAFTRARTLGWDLYATPGLLAGGADREVTELDVSSLAAAPENVLRRAPFTRLGRAHLALALLLPAIFAGGSAAWLQRDTLLDWIGGGPEPVTAIAPPTDPDLAVAVDSVALIEACRRALIDYPPWLPAWRIESLTCAARFSDPELAALRPELAGRAVMLAALAACAPATPSPCTGNSPSNICRAGTPRPWSMRGRGRSSRWPPCCASSRPRAALIPGVSPCCRP